MQKLSRKQFDILEALATNRTALTQRQMEDKVNYSLGTINRTLKELNSSGFVVNGMITEKGFEALEPYRAKRAIFIAAGFGSRMVPITLNTPKPLVRVHGKRIIDGLIDACLQADINEIYIVRGYLAEQFDQLLYKYPMIKFLENPVYNEANNIASSMCAPLSPPARTPRPPSGCARCRRATARADVAFRARRRSQTAPPRRRTYRHALAQAAPPSSSSVARCAPSAPLAATPTCTASTGPSGTRRGRICQSTNSAPSRAMGLARRCSRTRSRRTRRTHLDWPPARRIQHRGCSRSGAWGRDPTTALGW